MFNQISFRNFACLDSHTNKFFLNLESLSEYSEDRLNFIATIGCEFQNDSHNLIDISENPITIVNGISYFLLSAKSCQLDILKLLYMLSQSLYVSIDLLPHLEVTIDKAVALGDAWDVRNFLYVVNSGYESASGLRTLAETNMSSQYMEGKPDSPKQALFVHHLEAYFSNVSQMSLKNQYTLDIERIRANIRNEYDPFTTRVYLYDSIVSGCAGLLPSHKPIALSKFQELNCQELSEQLFKQAMNNFEIFCMSIVEGARPSDKLELKKIKMSILEPFLEWEMTWLSKSKSFKAKKTEVAHRTEEEFFRIRSFLTKKAEKSELKKLQDSIKSLSVGDIIGNEKLNPLQIRFSDYYEASRGKIYELISTLMSQEWRSQNKPIVTSSDLLTNLETRVEINERKKASLEEGIKLAQKEQDHLTQLVFAYVSKISPHENRVD